MKSSTTLAWPTDNRSPFSRKAARALSSLVTGITYTFFHPGKRHSVKQKIIKAGAMGPRHYGELPVRREPADSKELQEHGQGTFGYLP